LTLENRISINIGCFFHILCSIVNCREPLNCGFRTADRLDIMLSIMSGICPESPAFPRRGQGWNQLVRTGLRTRPARMQLYPDGSGEPSSQKGFLLKENETEGL
jgi:hypothetical protein